MSDLLLLLPTRFERERLPENFERRLPDRVAVRLCGFGPIAAAARTAQLIADLSPTRVVLLGIAGAYHAGGLTVGEALWFSRVSCEGVGVGAGERFRSAESFGWPQVDLDGQRIGDSLPLSRPESENADQTELLTVCAASSTAADADRRAVRDAPPLAEDMEGFGVALACALHGLPCEIVRGISNIAGDRNRDEWRIEEALSSAAELAAPRIHALAT